MQFNSKREWESDFRHRLDKRNRDGEKGYPVSIKIGVENGCYHQSCSPRAYEEIYEYLENSDCECDFIEHESGPEIVAWLALGTAGATLAKSIIDMVTAIINARAKGRKKGDRPDGDLYLLVRGYGNKENLKEEKILIIKDGQTLSSDAVEQAISNALNSAFDDKK